jgi:protein phosphatase
MTLSNMPHAARTDVGRRRDHNEDAFALELPLLAVADGVGGSARGEVASQRALDQLHASLPRITQASTNSEAVAAMEQAVLDANGAVHDAQLLDPQLAGMATTLTAAVLRDGGELIVGHVGDSRLYALSAAGARQLTADHSVIAELIRSGQLDPADAASHPQRNVITRALGPERDTSVDAFTSYVGPGEWILICSDGLTEHVADAEIASIVTSEGAHGAQAAADALVATANERGGSDNITVVLAQPVPSDVSGELRVEAIAAADTVGDTSTIALPPLTSSDAPADASGPMPTLRDVEASGELPALQPLSAQRSASSEGADSSATDSATPRRAILITLLIVLVAALGGAFIWSQSFFITERGDGRVGIDQGFPVAGLSSPYRTSAIEAASLSLADRARIVESNRIMSREDAVQTLRQLPERIETAPTTLDTETPNGDTENS